MKLKVSRKIQCDRSKEGKCRNSSCQYHYPISSTETSKTTTCCIDEVSQTLGFTEVKPDRILTFTERYKEHNKGETIFGTVWWGFYTFTEFYSQALGILACEGFGFPRGLIYDGYWLVFLSPFVLAYWILLLPMVLVFSIVWLLFWPLFVPLGIWSVFIELPASFLNKKEVDKWKC